MWIARQWVVSDISSQAELWFLLSFFVMLTYFDHLRSVARQENWSWVRKRVCGSATLNSMSGCGSKKLSNMLPHFYGNPVTLWTPIRIEKSCFQSDGRSALWRSWHEIQHLEYFFFERHTSLQFPLVHTIKATTNRPARVLDGCIFSRAEIVQKKFCVITEHDLRLKHVWSYRSSAHIVQNVQKNTKDDLKKMWNEMFFFRTTESVRGQAIFYRERSPKYVCWKQNKSVSFFVSVTLKFKTTFKIMNRAYRLRGSHHRDIDSTDDNHEWQVIQRGTLARKAKPPWPPKFRFEHNVMPVSTNMSATKKPWISEASFEVKTHDVRPNVEQFSRHGAFSTNQKTFKNLPVSKVWFHLDRSNYNLHLTTKHNDKNVVFERTHRLWRSTNHGDWVSWWLCGVTTCDVTWNECGSLATRKTKSSVQRKIRVSAKRDGDCEGCWQIRENRCDRVHCIDKFKHNDVQMLPYGTVICLRITEVTIVLHAKTYSAK